MNKKFLSAILFGALMVTSTGTFVSCKDYDDDIENLQTQIDKLATKDELTSQIASLQSALSTAAAEAAAAKTAAADALAKATAADKAAAQATLDAATAKAEAIAAAKAEVATAKAALEEAVDAKFEDFQAELSATVADLTAKVEKLTGLTTEMITSIDWQYGQDFELNQYWSNASVMINYAQMPESWTVGGKEVKTITFGKDMTGALTLNAKETFSGKDYMLISVSPANAVVTSDMLSVINSKGENLNKYIDLTVEPYKGDLRSISASISSRAAANTGLHLVTFKLAKNIDAEALSKVTEWQGDGWRTAAVWALAAEKDGRVVTTTYDLKVYARPETEEICNLAAASTIKSSIKDKMPLENYANYSSSVTTNNEWCYPVVSGEAFEIKTASECGGILASYVTVDINNANLSTTDKAAVNGLKFTGVNTVNQTGAHSITVTGATGVVVPLKVVAIGYDGAETSTIVWVKAGNSSAITQTAAYVVTPSAYVAEPTAYAYSGKQAFTVPAGAAKMEVSIYAKDEINIATTNDVVLNNSTLKFFKADGKTVATIVKDIAVAQLNATVNLQTMKDDKVYEGTVKFFNNEGTFLGQSAITIQKVLPTTLPEGFSVKTNQLNSENIYNCYLLPTSWTANSDKDAVNNGTMDMDHVFNWGKGASSDYIISFAEALWDATNKKDIVNEVDGDEDLEVAKGYIDNKTAHATTVAYNYGAISTAKYDADKKVFNNYTIEAASFSTVFHCIYNETYSWRWATHEDLGHKKVDGVWNGEVINTELTYGTDITVDVTANIQGISSRDGLYSRKFAAPYNNSLAIKEAHLVSDANNEADEYFKVLYTEGGTAITGFEATQTSSESNPQAAVASTLVITAYDMYGHTVTIKLPMTVKTR